MLINFEYSIIATVRNFLVVLDNSSVVWIYTNGNIHRSE